ncbi:helix-turn-helix transcriptional regulator, partial [Streptococcus agalactiae]
MTTITQNRVKELRKQAGLSQQALADQIGVMRKTI